MTTKTSEVMALADLIDGAMKAAGMTREELAAESGYSLSAIGDILIGKILRPGTKRREALAAALDIPAESILDASRRASLAAGLQRMPRTREEVINRVPGVIPTQVRAGIPVLGQAAGGTNGEYYFNGTVVDYAPRPPGLENVMDAYAVYVDGESMSPRYGPRDTVWVHPGKPPRPGDDVIVQIGSEGEPLRGYIKRFVGWSDKTLKLRQFNPAKELTFNRKDVVSVHPVVFIRPA